MMRRWWQRFAAWWQLQLDSLGVDDSGDRPA